MHHNLCKNCENTFEGNFCSNCGQKTNTKRLDWNYIKDEAKYTFLHLNNGLFYTIKQLFVRPGETINEFIQGKRIQHYKPILLVFVLAGLNGLLSANLYKNIIMPKNSNSKEFDSIMSSSMNWLMEHYAVFEICLLPLFSLCSYLAFKKWGYNFIENIIINCFAAGQRLAFGVVVTPFLYLIEPKYMLLVSTIATLPMYGLTLWTYYCIYKDKNSGDVILRILLFAFLIMLFFIILIVLGVLLAVLFGVKN